MRQKQLNVPLSRQATSLAPGDIPQPNSLPPLSLLPQAYKAKAESPDAATSRYKYKAVWNRALFKVKIRLAMKKVKDDILVYGTTHELTDAAGHYKDNIDELIERKKCKDESFRHIKAEIYSEKVNYPWLLHPEGMFKKVWSLILVVFMVYTALIVPYRIAFMEQVFWDGWTVLDLVVDFVFLVDIGVTFFSITQNDSGVIEFSRKRIALQYVKTWFALDLISCFPMTLVDYFQGNDSENVSPRGKYNRLMRLARLPRLYKLLRIVRLLKVVRNYSQSPDFERCQDYLHINSRLFKLLKFLTSVVICVHIMGCFWYFSAKIFDFEVDTWVVRCQLMDESDGMKYLTAVYWAVTTAATVGYGDIVPCTQFEVTITIAWMVVGVGFYSFTVGSLSSFMMSIDTRDSLLAMKLASVQEFARQVGLSPAVKLKIREALRYNACRSANVWSDKHSLFRELPKSLRREVAWSMYDGIAKEFPLFRQSEASLLTFMMPLFAPLRLNDSEFLYVEGDYADQVYFITLGRVNFVLLPSEISYKSFLKGSYIGEIEMLKRTARLNTAMCCNSCEFLALGKTDFNRIIDDFPAEAKQIRKIAAEKANRNKQSMLETMELLKLKAANGSLAALAGKKRLINVEQEDEREYSLYAMLEQRTQKVEKHLETHRKLLSDLTKTVDDIRGLILRTFRLSLQVASQKARSNID